MSTKTMHYELNILQRELLVNIRLHHVIRIYSVTVAIMFQMNLGLNLSEISCTAPNCKSTEMCA